jgi:hypothetical protein
VGAPAMAGRARTGYKDETSARRMTVAGSDKPAARPMMPRHA